MDYRRIIRRGVVACVGLAALLGPARAETLTILTGSMSGVYFPLGSTLASIYSKALPDLQASAQVTPGSVENLVLLQAGDGDLGFALGDTLDSAWNGDPDVGFRSRMDKLRGLSALYLNYVQIVASTQSGIQSLADLKGKRVSVGAERSGTELNARVVFQAAGVAYQDLGKVSYAPFGASAQMLEKGQLDASLQSAGLGVDSIRHLFEVAAVRLVPVPPDLVARINNPVYVAAPIPAATYRGQAADVPTAAIGNFLVTREGTSDRLAYAMTKLLFDSLDQLVRTHPAAKGINVRDALRGMPIPLHPGAEKYYRDIGLLN
ncbi:MAG TPA: TAXI family TRAP transporter solute-binding subunit [Alphaproteobacteria bacterium]